jgi:H+/Cl- antiporter ClcA
MAEEYKSRSKAWYLLPIFLGIIGGLIGFFVLRKDSPKMARNCLIIGIIVIAIGIALSIAGSIATLNGMTDMVVP